MVKITKEKLKQKVDMKHRFVLIQVDGAPAYRMGHIPGAEMIDGGSADFAAQVEKNFPLKNQEVILYAERSSMAADAAGKKLEAAGYRNINVYSGSLDEWKKAQFDVVK